MNFCLYHAMKMLKDKKLAFLVNEKASVQNTTTQNLVPDKKIVVTIPDDLPLTAAEKSVQSKGLTFVPVNNKVDEYHVKADCEKCYRRLRHKLFFTIKPTTKHPLNLEICPTLSRSLLRRYLYGLASFVKTLPTYVKDTNHVLHKFHSFRLDNILILDITF